MTVQPGLCQTWSEPKLLVFSHTGSYVFTIKVKRVEICTGSFQIAAEFAKVLLHLTEGFSLPSFRGQRFNSLVALAVCAPKPVSISQDYKRIYQTKESDKEMLSSKVPMCYCVKVLKIDRQVPSRSYTTSFESWWRGWCPSGTAKDSGSRGYGFKSHRCCDLSLSKTH